MKWFRKPSGDPLMVSMCGIKLGDRLLVIGGSDVPLIAALASKSGLTGRACVVDESAATRDHVGPAVEKEGALIESFAAPLTALPFDSESFDVVVARNFMRSVTAATANAAACEIHRVVRPGGRCVLIDDSGRGLSSLVGGERAEGQSEGDASGLLASAGFRGVRRLAEREGHAFVEGVKAGQGG
jgi:ubiquinone/menaquinone biosynthesis C-methylase UbiE